MKKINRKFLVRKIPKNQALTRFLIKNKQKYKKIDYYTVDKKIQENI